jgi:hypothetical protein
MFRFRGANAALVELVVTSAILAATVGHINAQDAFQPYSVELLDNKHTYGLKNCSDSAGCGPGAGDPSAENEGFAKFKKHFKKKADKTAKVCDVIVYGERRPAARSRVRPASVHVICPTNGPASSPDAAERPRG